jgi:HEAT repeat protein
MRTRAAHALGRARSVEARRALREALEEDDYAFVREAAARALVEALAAGETGESAEDRAALARAAAEDDEPRVRAAARVHSLTATPSLE